MAGRAAADVEHDPAGGVEHGPFRARQARGRREVGVQAMLEPVTSDGVDMQRCRAAARVVHHRRA